MLLIPTPPQLLHAGESVPPGCGQRREAGSVDPHGVASRAQLEHRDGLRGLSQQLAIMTHQQHRFLGALELALQPALGRHIQEVVRLVKQQDLIRTTKQRFER